MVMPAWASTISRINAPGSRRLMIRDVGVEDDLPPCQATSERRMA
ncbi:hypothetical protein [Pseudonocardia sp. GCM10023141]